MTMEEAIKGKVIEVFDINESLFLRGGTAQLYMLARSALANLLYQSGYSVPQIAKIAGRSVRTVENDYLRFHRLRMQQVERYRERFIKCREELKIGEEIQDKEAHPKGVFPLDGR